MDEVEVQCGDVPSVGGADRVHGRREVFHRVGNTLVEHEVEAGVADRVGDPFLGVRDEVGAVVFQPYPGASVRADHHRGDGVAEEAVREQVAHGEVVGLVAQRAELAGHDEDVRLRVGGAEVVGAVDGCAAGGAAQLRDRKLPGLRPEPHGVDEPGGEGGHHEAGARHIDDHVDVLGPEFGVSQGPAHRRGDPGLRLGLVDRVASGEAGVLQGDVDRLHQVPGRDTGAGDEPECEVELGVTGMQAACQVQGLL